jgi:xanthine dehydrogenase accessory factor
MKYPLAAIADLLDSGRPLVLARIIRQAGSAPRDVGTQCLFLEDGSIVGTIGGGLLEYQASRKASECLQHGRSTLLQFQLTGQEVSQTDMLCGGIVDVYLEPLLPGNKAARTLFRRLSTLLASGCTGVLITQMAEASPADMETGRVLIEPDGAVTGQIGPSAQRDQQDLSFYLKHKAPQLISLQENQPLLFVEPIKPYDVLYLFGAGHISTFVADLAQTVGFQVVVIDDREEFASRQRFPTVQDILVCPFSSALARCQCSASSYIVIVTRGHIHDQDILRQALDVRSAYIGMIGSRRKRDMIYEALRKEGVSQESLDRVHSPIGLDIGAQTPEEIAVSIVAELIQVRAGMDKPAQPPRPD